MTTNDKMKRKYMKPAFRTVELQHRASLLQTSATRTSYGTAIEEDWE